MEDDNVYAAGIISGGKFQPTSSAWRTTSKSVTIDRAMEDFNPRPPHGGRPGLLAPLAVVVNISTHVLRMEDDRDKMRKNHRAAQFQPTSSAWRTTRAQSPPTGEQYISTHVLRMEDDYRREHSRIKIMLFQPTSSAWRTTSG